MDAFEEALMRGSKTPLMWLQEICVKQGCSMPNFVERDLRNCPSDPPMFEITATVFKFQGKDYSEKGLARNKKDAKQKSAVNVLYAMGIRPQDLTEIKSNKSSANPYRVVVETVDSPVTAAPPKTADSLVNDTLIKAMGSMEISITSVTELNDLCEKRNLPSAEYELVDEKGPPHCKTFYMTCRIRTNDNNDHVTTGIENQKQKAKRRAAMLMLDKLRSMKHSEDTLRDLVSRTINQGINGSLRAPCNNRQNCQQLISHTQHRFQCFSGAAIRRLNDEADIDYRDNQAILAEIKGEENFEVEFKDAPLPAEGGSIQCYCILTYPQSAQVGGAPSVFVGSGTSSKSAREDSASKTLQFLREMTKP